MPKLAIALRFLDGSPRMEPRKTNQKRNCADGKLGGEGNARTTLTFLELRLGELADAFGNETV